MGNIVNINNVRKNNKERRNKELAEGLKKIEDTIEDNNAEKETLAALENLYLSYGVKYKDKSYEYPEDIEADKSLSINEKTYIQGQLFKRQVQSDCMYDYLERHENMPFEEMNSNQVLSGINDLTTQFEKMITAIYDGNEEEIKDMNKIEIIKIVIAALQLF